MEPLETIKAIIHEAGKILLGAHLNRSEIIQKSGHQNFVTEYDKKVQDYLENALSAAFPQAKFYGEEDEEHNEEALSSGDVFVIDPIDGTSNFMKGLFPSCISIGMLRDGFPYFGMIYVPQSDELFWAIKGKGAFRNGVRIHSSDEPLSGSLGMFGTAPYYSEELRDMAYRLARSYQEKCIDMRRSGSAAYDLCLVASGVIGLYVEPVIQLWDYCAGALIASEAGAAVTDLSGGPIDFRNPSPIIAVSQGVAREDYLPSI